MRSPWRPILWPAVLLSRVACGAPNNSTVAETFPLLTNLQQYPASRYLLSVGSQDLNHCCLLAVNDSLSVINGILTGFKPGQTFITDDFPTFKSRQFPCNAGYIGDKQGAPLVTISYSYCEAKCPGWQRSTNAKLNQWISPFAGFIIPAIVFCLAIPRRRKIWVPDFLFNIELNRLTSAFLTILFIIVFAAIIAAVDTVVWLLTIFALSGPILVSGIYEAFLDNILLQYVQEKIDNQGLSMAARARILYVILVGNLDMTANSPEEGGSDRTWDHIDIDKDNPEHHSLLQSLRPSNPTPTDIDDTKTQLRTMLASQYSFGVTVGAPVVFFCASFIYGLFDNYSNLGDNDTSHALAFGMWWMTIPHIAIISGLLLAGNNPNTLEAVVRGRSASPMPRKWYILEPVYDSRYRPAWIWDRGREKRLWVKRLQQEHHGSPDDGFEKRIKIGLQNWITIAALAWALIVIPSTLAFLTSYFTPRIGLSCRSMTFLIYMLSQLCLILLWVWNIQSAKLDQDGHPHVSVTRTHRQQQQPDRSSSEAAASANNPTTSWHPWVWYPLVTLTALCATFTGIGGTMMQIIGVYRNCLCDIPITAWHRRYDNELLLISTNSADDIHRAETVWRGTGIAAVVFLIFVSFVGWWYQKRLRFQFKNIIARIDVNPQVQMMIMNGRLHHDGDDGDDGDAGKTELPPKLSLQSL